MSSTYNLARMNMFLHGVLPENQHLHNGDLMLTGRQMKKQSLMQ